MVVNRVSLSDYVARCFVCVLYMSVIVTHVPRTVRVKTAVTNMEFFITSFMLSFNFLRMIYQMNYLSMHFC